MTAADENDVVIPEDQAVRSYLGAITTDISPQQVIGSPDIRGVGGPVYV